jgi:c-di-GMP-binding flagellar brake protein YcgR
MAMPKEMNPAERERYESEKREFVRIKIDIPVRYKFLSKSTEVPDEVFEGTTGDIGGGGMLLMGRIPNPTWYVGLLTQQIVLGINLLLPATTDPIKALCRVAWIEATEADAHGGRVAMGLKFREIPREALDEIFKFVIKAQLK